MSRHWWTTTTRAAAAAAMAAVVMAAGAPAAMAAGDAHAQPNLIPTAPEGLVTAVVTLIVFAALVAVLGKYAWGPIAAGLKAREDKIRKDIADAEAARARAEATLAEYKAQLATAEAKVRQMINDAVAQGEQAAAEIKLRGQQEAEESRARVNRDIEAARKQAIADIYAQAAEISTSIAEKILRRNLNPDDQRDLVQRSLDEFATAGR